MENKIGAQVDKEFHENNNKKNAAINLTAHLKRQEARKNETKKKEKRIDLNSPVFVIFFCILFKCCGELFAFYLFFSRRFCFCFIV